MDSNGVPEHKGRPSSYTPELADELCARIIHGDSLRKICSEDGFPSTRTVFNWLRSNEAFLQQYARAKEAQAEAFAEELLDISDEEPTCTIEGENWSKVIIDPAGIQRNKLRVDTRKWLMSKMLPRKYGERVHNEHSGPNGAPLEFVLTRTKETK